MNKKIILLITTSLLLVSIFGFISPTSAGLPLYIFVFSLIYIISFLVIILFLDLAYSTLPKAERRFIALVLGFSPTLVLALASLSSLSVIDFALAVGVPIIIIWYGVRRGAIK